MLNRGLGNTKVSSILTLSKKRCFGRHGVCIGLKIQRIRFDSLRYHKHGFIVREASRSDLIGDIDGINIGNAYDSSRSLADNLNTYYSKKSGRRYHEFIANSKNPQSKAELPLEPGKKPPKLSMQARRTIASHVHTYLVYFLLNGLLYSGTDPAKRKLVDSMVEIDSPEIGAVVDYFVRFLEDGLALEYRRGVRP